MYFINIHNLIYRKSELNRNGELDANEVKEDNTLDESNLENEGPVDIDHYQINTAERNGLINSTIWHVNPTIRLRNTVMCLFQIT